MFFLWSSGKKLWLLLVGKVRPLLLREAFSGLQLPGVRGVQGTDGDTFFLLKRASLVDRESDRIRDRESDRMRERMEKAPFTFSPNCANETETCLSLHS